MADFSNTLQLRYLQDWVLVEIVYDKVPLVRTYKRSVGRRWDVGERTICDSRARLRGDILGCKLVQTFRSGERNDTWSWGTIAVSERCTT